jgi:hypothetical protein
MDCASSIQQALVALVFECGILRFHDAVSGVLLIFQPGMALITGLYSR